MDEATIQSEQGRARLSRWPANMDEGTQSLIVIEWREEGAVKARQCSIPLWVWAAIEEALR